MQKYLALAACGHQAFANLNLEAPHSSDDHLADTSEYEWRPEKLTVHMVHHTHCDVGWLKTVDEYYSGTNNSVQRVSVQLILDEVMKEMVKDPKKRFSYVEMKFFSMWWRNQTEDLKEKVR
jgi:hypothetical protein